MYRRYEGRWNRFSQPDPFDGSYSLSNPQSFNRYAYVENDPVNFVDPSGLLPNFTCEPNDTQCLLGSVTIYGGGPDPIGDAFGAGNGNSGWGGDGFGGPIGGGGRGGGGQQGTDPTFGLGAPPPPPKPIYCQPDVIEAMKKAWSQSGNGGMSSTGSSGGVEAGFNVNGTPGNYQIDQRFTNQQNKMTIRYNTLKSSMPTFSNFHVHPKGRDGNNGAPSTPGNTSENNGRGDTGAFDDIYNATGQAIQVYVLSRYGLSRYDPRTKQITQVRKGLDFLDSKKPCP